MDEGYHSHIIEHPEISVRDVRILRTHQPSARRIVDVGCGRGGFVDICRQQMEGVLGLDPEPSAARICDAQGLPFLLGDAVALPFVSGSLDVVRAKHVVEHWTDALSPTREVHRALRPGGLFLCHVPTQFSTLYPVANFWDDYTHVRPLTRFGLRRLLEDGGFEVIFIKGYTPGRNLAERLLGRLLGVVFPVYWLALARKPEE
jgi:SAM-dependent methyltransferase